MAARLLMWLAVLNLIFLFTEIALNVLGVRFL
jgi:hypothetical protein